MDNNFIIPSVESASRVRWARRASYVFILGGALGGWIALCFFVALIWSLL